MSSHADSALVHAVLAGEVPRFGELVARYDAKVRAVVGRLLADPEAREDAVQETFYRAFRHLGDLDRPERFGAWLVGIARNAAAEQGRRAARREALVLARLEGVERAARGGAPLAWIWEEVGRLAPDQAQVLRLRYAEGSSYGEIARRLGLPESTVRGRIYLARRALRRRLAEGGLAW